MFFRVKRKFKWVSELPAFEAGEVIEIADRHPRLEPMIRGLYVYDDISKTQEEMEKEYKAQMEKKRSEARKPQTPVTETPIRVE